MYRLVRWRPISEEGRVARPKTDARSKLLEATMEHLVANGVGDLTLRQLATAIGTSHRMLIFHFGSKEGLLVEVVATVEQQQRGVLEQVLTEEPDSPLSERIRKVWSYSTKPEYAPYLKLFFEVYGQALQGRPHTTDFLAGTVNTM